MSAPVMFAHTAIDRIASEFAMRHPAVELELRADDRCVDLVVEGCGVVIRVDPRPDPKLVGRCFMRDRLLVVPPPSLPDPVSGRGSDFGLSARAVVCSSDPDDRPWRVIHGEGAIEIQPQPALRVSTQLMVLSAVRAGAGAARLPSSLVSEDVAEGRLASWGTIEGDAIEWWALHTSRRFVSPKVEAFISFLCAEFATNSEKNLQARSSAGGNGSRSKSDRQLTRICGNMDGDP